MELGSEMILDLVIKSWSGSESRITVSFYPADFSPVLLKMVLHKYGKLKLRGVYEPIRTVSVHVTKGLAMHTSKANWCTQQ